jgi:hypothetical protein
MNRFDCQVAAGIAVACLSCAATRGESTERWTAAAPPDPVRVSSSGIRNPRAEFQGFVLSGRELLGFRACGSNEIWWLDLTEISAGRDRLATKATDGCYAGADVAGCSHSKYVELSGELSESGRYGHMAMFKHELRAREVFYVANVGPPTCKLAPALQPRQ